MEVLHVQRVPFPSVEVNQLLPQSPGGMEAGVRKKGGASWRLEVWMKEKSLLFKAKAVPQSLRSQEEGD